MWDKIKSFISVVLLYILAYIRPVENEVVALFIILGLNFLFGYLSGMIANHEEFDWKKFFRCILEGACMVIICVGVFVIGRLKHHEETAATLVSWCTYVMIYCYSLNIFKNLKKIFIFGTAPWLVVAFFYYVLRFKFIEKIPFLATFINFTEHDDQRSKGKIEGDAR